MMRIFLLLTLLALLNTGCATSDSQSQSSNDTDPAPVSTIPWNRPQSWEGTGALGGAVGR